MQKSVFLENEADAFFERNRNSVQLHPVGPEDLVTSLVLKCENSEVGVGEKKLLEIGCGEGARIDWLSKNKNYDCVGVDPSEKAVDYLRKRQIAAFVGTADRLEFASKSFDIVIFGFCLYLCDRDDLFLIAHEANRVLKDDGWLIVQDFFAEQPFYRKYKHYDGIFTHKMNYRDFFLRHPYYECYHHEICGHDNRKFVDDHNEWVATSLIRKSAALYKINQG